MDEPIDIESRSQVSLSMMCGSTRHKTRRTGSIDQGASAYCHLGSLLIFMLLLSAAMGARAVTITNPLPIDRGIGDERGSPLLRNFAPVEYGAAVQNWAIVQDHRGVIYVGNAEDGVLEYDGVRWRRLPVNNRTTVRSLAVAADGRVYIGAVGEIGYLVVDAAGQTQYVSLLDRLPAHARDFADVWSIFAAADGVYFSTFKRIIRVSESGVRIWDASSSFHLAFQVGNAIYVRETGRGLLQLVNDELVLVPAGERFANEKVHVMLPWHATGGNDNSSILIGTRSQGWFLYDGKRLRPWVTQVDTAIRENSLYRGIWLANGTIAVGTLRGGVYLLDVQGRLLSHIDKADGLADSTVFDVFQDRDGGLWLGLDNGIARVAITEPVTHFGPRLGLEGNIIVMLRHAGILHVGTTQGLYRLVSSAQQAHFAAVPSIKGQTWALLEVGDALLVGGIQGVFELRGNAAELVRPSEQITFSLLPSRQNPARVFVGMHDGIASMLKQNGRWIDEGAIAGISSEVRAMYQQLDGRLWLGTWTTGIVSLRFADHEQGRVRSVPQVEFFGAEQGLPWGPNLVYPIEDTPVFATGRGIFQFQQNSGRFIPDPQFAGLFTIEPRQVSEIRADANGRVWMYSNNDSKSVKEAGAAVRDDGGYRWNAKPLRQLGSITVSAIYADTNEVLWVGGDGGMYRYDSRLPMDYEKPFNALVREVSARNQRLSLAGAVGRQVPTLAFAENALRFEFSAPSFGNQPNRFQVYLQGVDRDWSSWSTESYRDYTNIHEGTYRFHVRAMNVYGTVSHEDIYDFNILPPWYRTWLAYVGYVLLATVIFTGVSRWRSAVLRDRNGELARLVASRTEALQAANAALAELSSTDLLTGLKNRRYLIEHIGPDIAAVQRAYQEHPAGVAAGPDTNNTDLLLIMVDIDNFKEVNDNYGHAAGDCVLQQFARILQSVCRDTDTPVRWGGEEFMLVARFTNRESGPVVAERIRALTAAHSFTLEDGKTLRRTCSIGFASFPVFPSAPDRFSWEDTVKLADQCLYRAKNSGRNAWVGMRTTRNAPSTAQLREYAVDLSTLIEKDYLQTCRTLACTEHRAVLPRAAIN